MNSPSLCVKDVRNITYELNKFQKNYAEKFRTKTRNLKEQAFQYVKGKLLVISIFLFRNFFLLMQILEEL